MAKIQSKGLDEYVSQLAEINDIARECIGYAIYDGAGIIADEVKSAIHNIPVDNRRVKDGEMLNGINNLQKAGLLDGFGIAKMRDDNGYLNVRLGFEGYNGIKTSSFPSGQPNSVIARSVNAGTSFRQKFPFMDDAVRRARKSSIEKMKETFDEKMGKAIK